MGYQLHSSNKTGNMKRSLVDPASGNTRPCPTVAHVHRSSEWKKMKGIHKNFQNKKSVSEFLSQHKNPGHHSNVHYHLGTLLSTWSFPTVNPGKNKNTKSTLLQKECCLLLVVWEPEADLKQHRFSC